VAGRLLASVTLAPLPEAAWERVTVQVVEAAAVKVVPAHCKEEMDIVATAREMLVLTLLPFQPAVIDAD